MGLPRLLPDSEPILFLVEKLKDGELPLEVDAATVKAKHPTRFVPYEPSAFQTALKRCKIRAEEELKSNFFPIYHPFLNLYHRSEPFANRL